ncbi:MAG: sigma-54-dependent Fis family transcriptional regulator [Burkholderiales bacterium]|jgi:two-component system response regulator PilR (NtrC family)|nr:sigma-54-dependent Fis family transcriptional regulator [Burkholderiales bacterium]
MSLESARPGIARVLIVDDEPDLRELLELSLIKIGLDVDTAADLMQARLFLSQRAYQLCLTDMMLPDGNGLDLVRELSEASPAVPVAVLTAYGSAESAVVALKAGAFDYLTKPVALEQLRTTVQSALKSLSGTASANTVKTVVASAAAAGNAPRALLAGESPQIQELRHMILRLARSMAPVAIYGESGSGKEVAARAIHLASARADKPFIAVNCGAIPEALVEAEFFGYKKGAFTGADADRDGFFQAAHGGTLFLDEVAELPLPMQVKLLRAIQERQVRKLGVTSEQPVDVRIISATHRDLADQVKAGLFREDLYYRLHVIELQIPPLRERGEDILVLADNILMRLAQREGRHQPRQLTEAARSCLLRYSFPGNVRELENLLERASALATDDLIRVEDLGVRIETPPDYPRSSAVAATPVDFSLSTAEPLQMMGRLLEFPIDMPAEIELAERAFIEAALHRTQGNRTAAAQLLGVSFRHLRYRMKVLGIA